MKCEHEKGSYFNFSLLLNMLQNEEEKKNYNNEVAFLFAFSIYVNCGLQYETCFRSQKHISSGKIFHWIGFVPERRM